MKSIQITIFLLGIAVAGFAQTKDELAIRKIIEEEDIAFHTNTNRKVYISYWRIKPETRWVYSSFEGSIQFMKSNDFKVGMANNQYPPADNATFSYSDFVVKASGNTGWATYDKKAVTPDGKPDHTHEFKCMEKVGGIWKIISASVHQYKPQ